MKKTRFLALALVVAVMMMGAGYAAWNETVTINNTVATGELDVVLSDGTATITGIEDGYVIERTNDVIAQANNKTLDTNAVDLTFTNLYPGAVVDVVIPIANNGSIPVKMDPAKPFTPIGNPSWLTITPTYAPATLAVNGTDDITFTMTVGEGAPENATGVQFTLETNYLQFNK